VIALPFTLLLGGASAASSRTAWYRRRSMIASLPDSDLVGRIAARDSGAAEAEAELCRRFAPRIRLYGLRHLRDEDRARDLVQGVLLTVIEAARAGRIEDPARSDRFVLGTCRNLCARVRESAARLQPMEPHAPELDTAILEPDVERLDVTALFGCLMQLEERSRHVVTLSFRDGHSADEIAALLETTAGNVRVLRHRAVAQLRRCIDSKQERSQ
jgi:RNA polymerase sigma-70 factor (ECF subfamily)